MNKRVPASVRILGDQPRLMAGVCGAAIGPLQAPLMAVPRRALRIAGYAASSAGAKSGGDGLKSALLATILCGLSPSTRITRSLPSNGGKRTRSAISKPFRIRSTRWLVPTRCTSTFGHSAMNRAIISATWK